MAKMPQEGTFARGKMDRTTGAQWVHVTPQMARNHPQGRLSPLLWLIVLYFVLVAGIRVAEVAAFGVHVHWGLSGVLIGVPLICAALLAMRAPMAAPLVVALSVLAVLGAVKSLSDGNLIEVINTAALVGIAMYLIDGDRPNLIYRHRFRSYASGADDEEKGA